MHHPLKPQNTNNDEAASRPPVGLQWASSGPPVGLKSEAVELVFIQLRMSSLQILETYERLL